MLGILPAPFPHGPWRRGSREGYGLHTFWWGGTGIRNPDLLLESQECNHYAMGATKTLYVSIFFAAIDTTFSPVAPVAVSFSPTASPPLHFYKIETISAVPFHLLLLL